MKKLFIASVLAAVGGCAHHIRPAATEYNGDSVTIATRQHHPRHWALKAATREADRICQKEHGKQAEHASSRKDSAARTNYDLFLCLN
ncbi:hypothetical protein [Leisingera sp. JC1]|uniref:hypothetical protein n=1 Tax=Leisingera sp. JC1 TaxID=1855282 RepID=UPI0008032EF9|nr:hypothetical protein [Leisingera sp. JC1]OBY25389.1 hypothetical protein A9D60_06315 [Leisingera sp. JC1]